MDCLFEYYKSNNEHKDILIYKSFFELIHEFICNKSKSDLCIVSLKSKSTTKEKKIIVCKITYDSDIFINDELMSIDEIVAYIEQFCKLTFLEKTAIKYAYDINIHHINKKNYVNSNIDEIAKLDDSLFINIHNENPNEKSTNDIINGRKLVNIEDRKRVFENDCNVTFPALFRDYFEKHKFDSIDEIPKMFQYKFQIFLFMAGCNENGESVRKSVLKESNAFEIFSVLEDFLIDNDFIVPQKYKEMVNDFITTYQLDHIALPNEMINNITDSIVNSNIESINSPLENGVFEI